MVYGTWQIVTNGSNKCFLVIMMSQVVTVAVLELLIKIMNRKALIWKFRVDKQYRAGDFL